MEYKTASNTILKLNPANVFAQKVFVFEHLFICRLLKYLLSKTLSTGITVGAKSTKGWTLSSNDIKDANG